MDKLNRNIDFWVVGALLFLCTVGAVVVFSATYKPGVVFYTTNWFKQITYYIMGAGVAYVVSQMPLRAMFTFANIAYGLSLLCLLYIDLGGGVNVLGAERWISIAGFRFQPSELAKIAYVLAYARILADHKVSLHNLKSFIKPLALFTPLFLLIAAQPDLTTALSFLGCSLIFFYWGGMSLIEILILLSPLFSVLLSMKIIPLNEVLWPIFFLTIFFLMIKIKLNKGLIVLFVFLNVSSGFGASLFWNQILHEHQRNRIITFIDPMNDPRGKGYQSLQSKVAVGSGGITGKGFMQGSQTQLNFLPEDHTDFIFSTMAEQFGLFGCTSILVAYWILLSRCLKLCNQLKSRYGNFLIIGSCAMIGFHVIVNIAMTVGLMPVAGVPLPLVSYGGSFVITCSIFIGLIHNVKFNAH